MQFIYFLNLKEGNFNTRKKNIIPVIACVLTCFIHCSSSETSNSANINPIGILLKLITEETVRKMIQEEIEYIEPSSDIISKDINVYNYYVSLRKLYGDFKEFLDKKIFRDLDSAYYMLEKENVNKLKWWIGYRVTRYFDQLKWNIYHSKTIRIIAKKIRQLTRKISSQRSLRVEKFKKTILYLSDIFKQARLDVLGTLTISNDPKIDSNRLLLEINKQDSSINIDELEDFLKLCNTIARKIFFENKNSFLEHEKIEKFMSTDDITPNEKKTFHDIMCSSIIDLPSEILKEFCGILEDNNLGFQEYDSFFSNEIHKSIFQRKVEVEVFYLRFIISTNVEKEKEAAMTEMMVFFGKFINNKNILALMEAELKQLVYTVTKEAHQNIKKNKKFDPMFDANKFIIESRQEIEKICSKIHKISKNAKDLISKQKKILEIMQNSNLSASPSQRDYSLSNSINNF